MKPPILLIYVLIMCSCSPQFTAPEIGSADGSVVSITDLFQAGHERFQGYLSEDSLSQAIWMGRREQVIMVLMDIEWEDGDREQAQQSGIILQDGDLVLTAGHGFIIEDGEILEIRGRLVSGREITLNLLGFRYDPKQVPIEDWALLRPGSRLPFTPFIPLAGPVDGQKLMVLGYPATLGLLLDGGVVLVREAGAASVLPLGMICSHHIVDRNTLFPRVGTIPLRGISGSPVFDSNGELVGLFSSVGRRRTLLGWDYIFGMADIPWTSIAGVAGK